MRPNRVREPWYGAKCIFQHHNYSRDTGLPLYEERITLVRARDWSEAVRKGEAEAKRYAAALKECEYLGFIEVFHLFASTVKEGSEVYSIMRSIALPKDKFIDRFYDNETFHHEGWQDPQRLKRRKKVSSSVRVRKVVRK